MKEDGIRMDELLRKLDLQRSLLDETSDWRDVLRFWERTSNTCFNYLKEPPND